VALAGLAKGHLHIAHISSAGALETVRQARSAGIHVTAEVSPHHLWLTDAAVEGYNTNAKMNPPLRTEEDRQALRAALADGTIDVVATDHAPHHKDEKDVEFDQAAHGVVGLETLLPLTLRLVHDGLLDLPTAIAKITSEPARILRLAAGRLEVGVPADLVVIDPDHEWVVSSESLLSKSKNTAFDGWKMRGRALVTLVDGRIVHDLRPNGVAAAR
jgi:dihydroorotase